METPDVPKPSLEMSEADYHDDIHLLPTNSQEEESWGDSRKISSTPRRRNVFALWTILISSVAVNISQAWWLAGDAIRFHLVARHISTGAVSTSIWDESFNTIQRPVYPKEQYAYTALGSQVTDNMFRSFDPDKGVVALPKGLPNVLPSKEFPWDTNKEVFVLSGYHSLHSLKLLWSELHRLSGDKPLTSHVLHSLNVLWQDTLCAARTDPMTISEIFVRDRALLDRVKQTRQCRDWSELEQLRHENSACFKSLGGARKHKEMIAEWQFCPDGSPYQAAVDQYLASTQHTT